MKSDHILLTGIKDPKQLEDRLSDELIDIVGGIEISDEGVRVSPDVGFDLRRESDADSFLDLLIGVLREAGEDEFGTQIVFVASHEERGATSP